MTGAVTTPAVIAENPSASFHCTRPLFPSITSSQTDRSGVETITTTRPAAATGPPTTCIWSSHASEARAGAATGHATVAVVNTVAVSAIRNQWEVIHEA